MRLLIIRTLLSVALLLLVVVTPKSSGGLAQEYPNPLYETSQFDPNAQFRQYVCDRQTQYDQGSIEFLADALEGLEIRAIFDRNSPYFILDEDGKISEDYPGLMAVLMDEIARLGKFTWRNSFTTYAFDESANKTWTDLLVWSAATYDVVAGQLYNQF